MIWPVVTTRQLLLYMEEIEIQWRWELQGHQNYPQDWLSIVWQDRKILQLWPKTRVIVSWMQRLLHIIGSSMDGGNVLFDDIVDCLARQDNVLQFWQIPCDFYGGRHGCVIDTTNIVCIDMHGLTWCSAKECNGDNGEDDNGDNKCSLFSTQVQ